MPTEEHARARREALQIALQLPQDPESARLVLRYTLELVDGYLTKRDPVEDAKTATGGLMIKPLAGSRSLRLV